MVCVISYHIISSSLSLLLFIGLLDPRWSEQQNKTVDEKKQEDEIFAVGMYTHNMYACINLMQVFWSVLCQIDEHYLGCLMNT